MATKTTTVTAATCLNQKWLFNLYTNAVFLVSGKTSTQLCQSRWYVVVETVCLSAADLLPSPNPPTYLVVADSTTDGKSYLDRSLPLPLSANCLRFAAVHLCSGFWTKIYALEAGCDDLREHLIRKLSEHLSMRTGALRSPHSQALWKIYTLLLFWLKALWRMREEFLSEAHSLFLMSIRRNSEEKAVLDF